MGQILPGKTMSQTTQHRFQLWGWILFIASAIFFMASSINAGDPVSLIGGALFLVACFIFLAPLLAQLGANHAGAEPSPENSKIMHDLACLLIPQEIFTLKGHQGPQSPGITDTRLLQKFPCKINILRNLRANLRNFRTSSLSPPNKYFRYRPDWFRAVNSRWRAPGVPKTPPARAHLPHQNRHYSVRSELRFYASTR